MARPEVGSSSKAMNDGGFEPLPFIRELGRQKGTTHVAEVLFQLSNTDSLTPYLLAVENRFMPQPDIANKIARLWQWYARLQNPTTEVPDFPRWRAITVKNNAAIYGWELEPVVIPHLEGLKRWKRLDQDGPHHNLYKPYIDPFKSFDGYVDQDALLVYEEASAISQSLASLAIYTRLVNLGYTKKVAGSLAETASEYAKRDTQWELRGLDPNHWNYRFIFEKGGIPLYPAYLHTRQGFLQPPIPPFYSEHGFVIFRPEK